MGVRLDNLANPMLRTNLDVAGSNRSPGSPENGGQAAGTFAAGSAVALQGRLGVETIEQAPPSAEPAEVIAADAGAESLETDNTPVRLRDFRFFTAIETMRERELETRLDRLERELRTTNSRLRSSDSFSVRLDAQLDRARLEGDLDIIQSEIGRLRMERAFSSSSGAGAVAVPVETQPSNPDSAASLNLLA